MCAKEAEVVSVPGPRFSFASDNAVCVGTPAEIMTLMRFGKGDFFSGSLFLIHALRVHCTIVSCIYEGRMADTDLVILPESFLVREFRSSNPAQEILDMGPKIIQVREIHHLR